MGRCGGERECGYTYESCRRGRKFSVRNVVGLTARAEYSNHVYNRRKNCTVLLSVPSVPAGARSETALRVAAVCVSARTVVARRKLRRRRAAFPLSNASQTNTKIYRQPLFTSRAHTEFRERITQIILSSTVHSSPSPSLYPSFCR